MSGTFALGLIPAFFQHPSFASGAMLAIALLAAYSWLIFLALTAAWVFDHRVQRIWVTSGSACGALALLTVLVMLPAATGFILPAVLFAAYVCCFHVEKPAAA